MFHASKEAVISKVAAEKLAKKEFTPVANQTTTEVAGKVLDVTEAARIPTPVDLSAYLQSAKVSMPSSGVSMSTPRSFMNPSAVVLSAASSLSSLWLDSSSEPPSCEISSSESSSSES